MLVLTRKAQEQIHIGGGITISILKVKGNSVRIGIDAPDDVRILRGELPVFDEESGPTQATSTTAESPDSDDPVPHTLRGFMDARKPELSACSPV